MKELQKLYTLSKTCTSDTYIWVAWVQDCQTTTVHGVGPTELETENSQEGNDREKRKVLRRFRKTVGVFWSWGGVGRQYSSEQGMQAILASRCKEI